jgi:hypothetical protein
MVVIEVSSEEHWEEAERSLIAGYRAAGIRLLNVAEGGYSVQHRREPRTGMFPSGNCKRWEGLFDPSGQPMPPIIDGLPAWCKERGLHIPALAKVLKGQVRSYKGYTCPAAREQVRVDAVKPDHTPEAIERMRAAAARRLEREAAGGRIWDAIVDPAGKAWLGVQSLRAFAREQGVDYELLLSVCHGQRRSHRGYTCPSAWERTHPDWKPGYRSPEAVENIRAGAKKRARDPGFREKMREAAQAREAARREARRLAKNEKIAAAARARYERGEGIPSPETRARMTAAVIAANSKVFEGFCDPFGNAVGEVFNLDAFCRERNLSRSAMCYVYYGKQHAHKGWTNTRPEAQEALRLKPPKKPRNQSEGSRRKLSEKMMGRPGTRNGAKHSAETIARMKAAQSTPEAIARKQQMRGYKHSEEAIQKMRAAREAAKRAARQPELDL